MAFGQTRNRRRQDAQHRKDAVRAQVRTHGPGAVRTLCGVLLTAAVAWGAWQGRAWAVTSPSFALERVGFTGLTRAGEAELLRLGGVAPGQNLWRLDVAGVERAMLAHPWVREVEVTRQFPRGLSVRVEEHAPAAFVSLGDLYVVDEQGEPFKRLAAADALDVPLLTGLAREDWAKDPAAAKARLAAALEVARAYSAEAPPKRERLSEVRLLDDGGHALVAASGQEVVLGPSEPGEQLRRLFRVRAELQARGLRADVIRLDDRTRPGRVTVKLQGADPERGGPVTR